MSRCLQRLYLMLFRQRILTQIGENPDGCWRIAQRVFSAAPAIYSGLIGPTARLTIQAEVMNMLCHDPQRAERCFFDNVTSLDSHRANSPKRFPRIFGFSRGIFENWCRPMLNTWGMLKHSQQRHNGNWHGNFRIAKSVVFHGKTAYSCVKRRGGQVFA